MITIRTANPEDAEAIVAAVRSGFKADMLGTLIYGASGIVNYVREQISTSEIGSDTLYCVACDGAEVIGAVELRAIRDSLFLNYIAIKPEYRSAGIGKKLFKSALEMAGSRTRSMIGLDVFVDNTVAKDWYEGMGFIPNYRSLWWSMPATAACIESNAVLSGLPQARACYEKFGFSQFRLITSQGEYNIGLLCDNWFRINQPTALCDSAVFSALRQIDGSRSILAIVPSDYEPPCAMTGAKEIVQSARYSMKINGLLKRLS